MTIDRANIGLVSEPRTVEVEKGFLKLFAKATGETDPVYFDEDAARAAGHRGIPAPPTFANVLAASAPPKIGNPLEMVDIRRVLHGEQGFTHHRPIYAGDTLTVVTTTDDVYEKKGGELEFVRQTSTFTNQDGEVCIEMRMVLVVRNGALASA
jgi:acyl dehydratase